MLKRSSLQIFSLFISALRDLLRPRVILAFMLPLLASFVVGIGLVWMTWGPIGSFSQELLQSAWLAAFLQNWPSLLAFLTSSLKLLLQTFFVLLLLVPALVLVATILLSVFFVPVLVEEIRRHDFPNLTKKSNSVFVGLGTTMGYSLKYIASWLASLPFWFIPFGAIVIPFLLLSWFNSRVYTWEVLTEITSKAEISSFVETHGKKLFVIGLISTSFYLIPILNLFAPLLTSAVFSRYCLAQLDTDRNNLKGNV